MHNIVLAEPGLIPIIGLGFLAFLIIATVIVVVLFLIFRKSSAKSTPPQATSQVPPATQVISRKCPQCGAELKADVPEGLCPACLLQRGIATEGGAPPGTPPFTPPPLTELAKLFPQLEILEMIGQGGMGAVYKARQPALDRFVALKILAPRSGGDLDFSGRFSREARALARLSHPNIVGVHDFGTVEQPSGVSPSETPGDKAATGKVPVLHYFIMEFVDGSNLRQIEQAGKLTPREALQIIPQICVALQFAHDEGIVHRDIKPENVLLDKKGRVKIADFGLAKILGQEADLRLTGARDVMGTPHYMAPEQVEKPQEVDHRADIYSLGVVFYEMLTGELPLGKFDPPSHKVQIDVRLDEVVMRSLSKSPGRRYQNVSEVGTEVQTIAQSPSAESAQANAAEFIGQSSVRDYDLNIGYCLSRGWKLVKNNFWRVVGVNALVWVLLAFMGSFSITLSSHWPGAHLGSVVSIILAGPLMGGLYLYFLKLIRGERTTVETVFTGFNNRFLHLFLGNFIASLLVTVGLLCFLLPGIYLSTAWLFTLILIIDKRLDFWPAMELSRKVITRHWWKVFGFGLVLLALKIAGIFFCIIGFFIAGPIVHAALLYAYEDIFGASAGARARSGANAPVAPGNSSGAGWGVAIGVGVAIVFIAFLGLAAAIAIPNFVKGRHRAQAIAAERVAVERARAADKRLVAVQRARVVNESSQLAQEGWQLWTQHKLEAAAEVFQQSVSLDPANTNAWNGLGWAEFNSGKNKTAESAFQKALALDPDYPASLNGLGQIYLAERKYDIAETNLLRAAPRASAAAYGLARLYLLKGNFEQAEKWAQSALDTAEGNPTAQRMLRAAQQKKLSEDLRLILEPPTTGAQPPPPAASAETWAPTLQSGEKPDLGKIMEEAKDLMSKGQYEESLGRHIWFQNHEPEYGDSYQNFIRTSSAISDWVELGRRYPKAKQALVEIRDRKVTEFTQGRGYSMLFQEIAAINSDLQDEDATYALIQAIYKSDPKLAQQCSACVVPLLVARGEYQWCLNSIGNPDTLLQLYENGVDEQIANQKRQIERQKQSRQQVVEMYRQLGRTNDQNIFSPPDNSAEMGRSITNSFVSSARMIVEILVGSGHADEAKKISLKAFTYLPDPRIQSALVDAEDKIQKRGKSSSGGANTGAVLEKEKQPLNRSSGNLNIPSPAELDAKIPPGLNASRETWSPELQPGEKPDLMKIQQEATDLTAQGHYEESLQRHIWYHNHSRMDPSQAGVRNSFALSDWIELGRRYPKARQALIEIRNTGAEECSSGHGYLELFLEVQSINDEIGDEELTYQVFKRMTTEDQKLAQRCYLHVEQLLIERGDYELCRSYLGDPQTRFERIKEQWRQRKESEQHQEELQKQMNERIRGFQKSQETNGTAMPLMPPRPEFHRFADANFVREVRQLIEILVATKDKGAAENLRDQAVSLLDDVRLKSAVSDAEAKIQKQTTSQKGATDPVNASPLTAQEQATVIEIQKSKYKTAVPLGPPPQFVPPPMPLPPGGIVRPQRSPPPKE